MDSVAVSNETATQKPRKLVGAEVVAERLDIPLSSVYELARMGRIPGCIRLGRRMRFDPDRLERWLENGGETGGEK